jgi:hypothetical protein
MLFYVNIHTLPSETVNENAPSGVHELRGAVRFPLHLSVNMEEHPGDHAETRDISAAGVLLHCHEEYPVGSTIHFRIVMPGQSMGADHDVQVECTGRVVRSTPEGDKVAVAAIIDEYRITR